MIEKKKLTVPWKFTEEWIKRWMDWTKLPIPVSHESWRAVWDWVERPLPDEITDERITSDLKPALFAKHRRDTQDNQRRQDEHDIANKRLEAATKYADAVAVVAAKTPTSLNQQPAKPDGPDGPAGFWFNNQHVTNLTTDETKLLE